MASRQLEQTIHFSIRLVGSLRSALARERVDVVQYMNPVWLVGCIPLISLHAIDMHAFNFTFSINTQHVSLINPILLDLLDSISIEPYDFQ